MEEKDYRLSEQMVDYLTNFAKTGDPNGEGLPVWSPARRGSIRLGEGETRMRKVSRLKRWYNMLAKMSSGE